MEKSKFLVRLFSEISNRYPMSDTIKDKKFVELSYKITDQKTGDVLVEIEYPLGYVHGANDILAPNILEELKGKCKGDVVEVPIDCNKLYGPRDEGLVFTDYIENVPLEYHEVGTTIVMENAKGVTQNFIVTRVNDKTLTVDGNNPLCGREVKLTLKVLNVRAATDEEVTAGGTLGSFPDIGAAKTIPI
jgi:FKBP-type peptidyl-prolyl cis-trans isomerase SlyD